MKNLNIPLETCSILFRIVSFVSGSVGTNAGARMLLRRPSRKENGVTSSEETVPCNLFLVHNGILFKWFCAKASTESN